MLGVILAIAFLVYMFLTEDILRALRDQGDPELDLILIAHGVDILADTGTDEMTLLLIGLALLTCLVGIVNAMLMSVTERVKEIGTLKCVGAMDRFILQTYFIEASLQGMLGTSLGMVLGAVIAVATMLGNYGTYVFVSFPVGPMFVSLLLAALVGLVLSVLAAIAPAYWASRKLPVEALRVEE